MPATLDDVCVLDFSHALAGPYCTLLLAGYGASVYKVESPVGDMGRGWGPPYVDGEAAYFLGTNAGKKGVCVDLKKPEGRELCLRMMDKADVVVENFRIGTMDRLGLGFEQVRKRNPKLIYCSISGYGQDGPSRDQPAMDLILQASCGLMSVTGVNEGETVRCGHSVADITAGMFAVIGILMALRSREQTGIGQFVDVSMFDCMISAMASNFANYLGSGKVPGPLGTSFASIVPYRTFATADRDLAIAVGSEKLWVDFCEVIERADLAAHPDYACNALRVKNRKVLEPLLAAIFLTATAEAWSGRLTARGIPCSPVRTLDEVYRDPQSAVRGMFPVLTRPGSESFAVTGMPVKLPELAMPDRTPAPHLGQHSRDAVRNLLDYDDDAIDLLVKAGVLISA